MDIEQIGFRPNRPFRDEYWRLVLIAAGKGWSTRGSGSLGATERAITVTFGLQPDVVVTPSIEQLAERLASPSDVRDVITIAHKTAASPGEAHDQTSNQPVVQYAGTLGLSFERLVAALPDVTSVDTG